MLFVVSGVACKVIVVSSTIVDVVVAGQTSGLDSLHSA